MSRERLTRTRRSHYLSPEDLRVDAPGIAAAYERTLRRSDQGRAWMFAEDVAHGVLPWPRHSAYEATFIGPGAEALTRLAEADDRYGLTDLVHRFFQSAASSLLTTTDTTYEVELLRDPADADKVAGIRLEYILPGSVEQRSAHAVQHTPSGDIELDADLIFQPRLPDDLEQLVASTIDFLVRTDTANSMTFLGIQQRLGSTRVPFDAFGVAQRRLTAVGTAATGWHLRGLLGEDQLHPWALTRRLNFLAFCIQIRETILDQINELLRRLADRVGQGRLTLTGVPTLEDVQAGRDALATGSASLDDVAALAIEQRPLGTPRTED